MSKPLDACRSRIDFANALGGVSLQTITTWIDTCSASSAWWEREPRIPARQKRTLNLRKTAQVICQDVSDTNLQAKLNNLVERLLSEPIEEPPTPNIPESSEAEPDSCSLDVLPQPEPEGPRPVAAEGLPMTFEGMPPPQPMSFPDLPLLPAAPLTSVPLVAPAPHRIDLTEEEPGESQQRTRRKRPTVCEICTTKQSHDSAECDTCKDINNPTSGWPLQDIGLLNTEDIEYTGKRYLKCSQCRGKGFRIQQTAKPNNPDDVPPKSDYRVLATNPQAQAIGEKLLKDMQPFQTLAETTNDIVQLQNLARINNGVTDLITRMGVLYEHGRLLMRAAYAERRNYISTLNNVATALNRWDWLIQATHRIDPVTDCRIVTLNNDIIAPYFTLIKRQQESAGYFVTEITETLANSIIADQPDYLSIPLEGRNINLRYGIFVIAGVESEFAVHSERTKDNIHSIYQNLNPKILPRKVIAPKPRRQPKRKHNKIVIEGKEYTLKSVSRVSSSSSSSGPSAPPSSSRPADPQTDDSESDDTQGTSTQTQEVGTQTDSRALPPLPELQQLRQERLQARSTPTVTLLDDCTIVQGRRERYDGIPRAYAALHRPRITRVGHNDDIKELQNLATPNTTITQGVLLLEGQCQVLHNPIKLPHHINTPIGEDFFINPPMEISRDGPWRNIVNNIVAQYRNPDRPPHHIRATISDAIDGVSRSWTESLQYGVVNFHLMGVILTNLHFVYPEVPGLNRARIHTSGGPVFPYPGSLTYVGNCEQDCAHIAYAETPIEWLTILRDDNRVFRVRETRSRQENPDDWSWITSACFPDLNPEVESDPVIRPTLIGPAEDRHLRVRGISSLLTLMISVIKRDDKAKGDVQGNNILVNPNAPVPRCIAFLLSGSDLDKGEQAIDFFVKTGSLIRLRRAAEYIIADKQRTQLLSMWSQYDVNKIDAIVKQLKRGDAIREWDIINDCIYCFPSPPVCTHTRTVTRMSNRDYPLEDIVTDFINRQGLEKQYGHVRQCVALLNSLQRIDEVDRQDAAAMMAAYDDGRQPMEARWRRPCE